MIRGVGRSKSQTESEQKWFSGIRASWLFSPVSSFCDFYIDVPLYLGPNHLRNYLCEFIQHNTDPD